jgi:carboxyvinyl-carboxyphosphonate phosphorylmutase
MHCTERRKRFRNIITGDSCIHPASVFDPVSARIAESLGFECGMFAGSVASLTVLGDPDHIVLTLSEFAQQAHRICRGSEIALLVDADHGYGNALNAKRTVEELETAGVSGLSIEDTELPRPHGSGGQTRLVSIEEGIGKMRAAVAGRQDPDLVIAARTSAVSVTGMDDAIQRMRAYQDTGVDALFLIGVKQREQLDLLAGEARLPLILGGAGADIMDREYLASRGVRICLQGHQPVMAGIRAVYETMKALRDGVPPAELPGVPAKDWVAAYTRDADYDRWIREFLD